MDNKKGTLMEFWARDNSAIFSCTLLFVCTNDENPCYLAHLLFNACKKLSVFENMLGNNK